MPVILVLFSFFLSFFQVESRALASLITDHLSFIEGEKKLNAGNFEEAEKLFQISLSQDPNSLLRNRTHLYQVEVLLRQKKISEAARKIRPLERKLRSTVYHPQSLLLQAEVFQRQQQKQAFCKVIKKLYSRYPSFSGVKDWGFILSKNKFQGNNTQCSATTQDMRQRIRFLQFSGESAKLKAELSEAREGGYFSPEEWLSIEVAYLVSEGDVDSGLKLLAQNYESLKNNFNYLNQLASVAARAGEGALAIGSYYRAYKMAPRSQKGREALFQSAFLSYQFQDYDGATLKFLEFVQKFPRSKLSRDASWQLAWIRYLKNDFSGALTELNKLSKVRRQSQLDRIKYWTAMSHYRLGKPESAYPIFMQISSKKYPDFYSEASRQRLLEIEKNNKLKPKLAEKIKLDVDGVKKILSAQLLFLPADDVSAVQFDEYRDELDELPTLLESSLTEDSDTEPSEEEVLDSEVAESLPSEDPKEEVLWSNKKISEKFSKVQELIKAGLIEFAQAELREVERKVRGSLDRKLIISQYEKIQNFNRSSIIGTDLLRSSISNPESWKLAYPEAYEKVVRSASKKSDVPVEFIWGIMRAESSYKASAISPVGAMGLMQIMPGTGKQMAKLLKLENFEPYSLLEPDVAIFLGSKYLQRLLKKFEGEIPLAAAAYNAGPHRVKTWLNLFGNRELDEFIEHIPFVETRNYVKRVVANSLIYKTLYSSNSRNSLSIPLTSKVNLDFKGKSFTKETWEEL